MKTGKKVFLAIAIFVVAVITFAVVFFMIQENEENVIKTYFTFDEKTGRTIVVGPDADKWIPLEDYYDDSVQVDFNTVYMHNDIPMYRGTVNGEPREATEAYWNSMLLSTQPEVFFGYVYIGGD